MRSSFVSSETARRRAPTLGTRRSARTRRLATSQPALLGVLSLLAAGYTVGAVLLPRWFPLAAACVWLLIGGFFLRLRYLIGYYAVLTGAMITAVTMRDADPPLPGVLLTVVLTAVLVLLYARARERVGVQGSLGASMLVDLRERLLAQATIPPLAPGWQVDTVLRSAYGDSFSGDFLVASAAPGNGWLEIVLVDVSGKGQGAGTRSLLLSGAFGGLLGAQSREDFLVAANRYLLRQRWEEGFATAVHVAVDQSTGEYEVRGAGHPPAAHYRSGSGRWQLVDSPQGPLLGVVAGPEFPAHTGVLERGDALLLYTDGLVERRGGDIALGIDRLVGAAERVVGAGLPGAAVRIVESVKAAVDDDRALIMITRS
jgi:hypothetical protein